MSKLIKLFFNYFSQLDNIKILHYMIINLRFFNIKLDKIYKLVLISNIY